ncbi:MAG: B12-binding domain-containing protein [Candidatus Hydrothermarchaeales archaeon]
MEKEFSRLRDDIIDHEHDDIVPACTAALDLGHSPEEVVDQLVEGMRLIYARYEEDAYFLPDFVMSVEVFSEAMDFLYPKLSKEAKSSEPIIVGTVKGSVHDIGKNLFRDLLRGLGYSVYDLGVNVEPKEFVEEIMGRDAKVLCLSVYMSKSKKGIEKILRELERRGIRAEIKVLIGGYSVDKRYAKRIGADAYADDVFEGVEIVRGWID